MAPCSSVVGQSSSPGPACSELKFSEVVQWFVCPGNIVRWLPFLIFEIVLDFIFPSLNKFSTVISNSEVLIRVAFMSLCSSVVGLALDRPGVLKKPSPGPV